MHLLRAARWHKEINNHFLSFSYGWTEGKDGGKREREREGEFGCGFVVGLVRQCWLLSRVDLLYIYVTTTTTTTVCVQ